MIKNYNKRLDFRAWDRQTNSFIPKSDWYIDPAGCARWQANNEEIPSDRITIQQNTGLVDEKGEDIYEGDYLIAWDSFNSGVIVYKGGAFFTEDEYKYKKDGSILYYTAKQKRIRVRDKKYEI